MKNFITFEGCEGVGKSTQIKLLAEYLEKSGQKVYLTREPGGSPVADKVRAVILDSSVEKMTALCEAHLFAAARCEHIDKVIMPEAKESLVLCDRYIDSSFAYQGYARGLGLDLVSEINRYALENCMPEFTVFIDMRPSESWRKQKGRIVENDRMEGEAAEFHQKVYEGFKALSELHPERFITVVPCEDRNETAKIIREELIKRGAIR